MFEVGENIGPYRIISRLGQGGMATVYKAYHANLDRYVAIKALHPALKQDSTFLERFEREAKVIARLDHPNIVSIYDFNEHEGTPYLVMQFIEGQTLKARLKGGPLSVAHITHIVTSVGMALDYAHQQRVLHRDIKPSNIMLTEDGKILLTDFGLARMAHSGESTVSKDMLLGTPQYVSPEQARGDPELDAGTDIYSLGVVIYELIVGRVPFSADTPFAIIHDHIFTPLPIPSQVNPLVPEQVEAFLFKALAKQREDRYRTAGELVHAFNAAVEQAGADEVDAATRVIRHPTKELRKKAARRDESRKTASQPQATPQAPSTGDAVQRGRRIQRRHGSVWALVGLILLVILVVSGGITLGRVISEEFDRVYNQAESESLLFEFPDSVTYEKIDCT